ncbi:hypothetical protein ABPG75_007189 [Micractinium tetrahymenae]
MLLPLLLRALGRAVVALQLPPERRTKGATWQAAVRLASTVCSAVLVDTLARHLAEEGCGLGLLRQAAQLLAALPTECPPGEQPSAVVRAHLYTAKLMVYAAGGVPAAALQQACNVLPQALPQLVAALRLVAGLGAEDRRQCASPATLLCEAWGASLEILGQGAGTAVEAVQDSAPPDTGGFEALVPWCSAASVTLQALPLVAAVAEVVQHPEAHLGVPHADAAAQFAHTPGKLSARVNDSLTGGESLLL